MRENHSVDKRESIHIVHLGLFGKTPSRLEPNLSPNSHQMYCKRNMVIGGELDANVS